MTDAGWPDPDRSMQDAADRALRVRHAAVLADYTRRSTTVVRLNLDNAALRSRLDGALGDIETLTTALEKAHRREAATAEAVVHLAQPTRSAGRSALLVLLAAQPAAPQDGAAIRRSGLLSADDAGSPSGDAVADYLATGWRALRQPHPLFDPAWYLASNPDVLAAGVEPLTHYLEAGSAEGRRPNLLFDPAWYRATYADVAASGMEPLVHYIAHGAAEGRLPHPMFDAVWYGARHGLAGAEPWAPLAHYVAYGAARGDRPNAYLDPLWYLMRNPDVAADGINPIEHYFLYGWREGRNPSEEFDSRAYVERYPEVAAANFNPLQHFLAYGWFMPPPPSNETLPSHGHRSAASPSVVYLSDGTESASYIYRVLHQLEALHASGVPAIALSVHDGAEQLALLTAADIVVFARVAWSPLTERIVRACRAKGVVLAFEIDDYVFDPAIANDRYVDGIRFLTPDEQHEYHLVVVLYRRMLLACDWLLTTTRTLAEAGRALGIRAAIIPNTASATMVSASEAAYAARAGRAPSRRIVIGYASGSRTHQRDFASAVPALARILAAHEAVVLRIVGAIDLAEFPALARFADRVELRPLVPHAELPFELARFDINIAPLEVGNPYCEAKSNLKFYEAALVGVPSVASATQPFRDAIEPGVTGFVATSNAEWEAALTALVTQLPLRRRIGEAARLACLELYTPRHNQVAVEEAFGAMRRMRWRDTLPVETSAPPQAVSAPAGTAQRLRIGWVVPGLIIGGGGHRNILRAAHFLQTFGHDVAIYFIDTLETAETLKQRVFDHFYPFTGAVFSFDTMPRTEDVVLATHWSTVETALRIAGERAETIYFVQDFEPSFAPVGSEYLLAESTYLKGLYAITSGPWCEAKLKRDYGMEADHFRFPVDRSVYRLQPQIERRKRILFFAKPEMPRRCFEIGLMALTAFNRLRPDVEIVFFGSKEARHRTAGLPVTFEDVLPGIEDLAALYATARLGIVFSTTNPSLVPYEMMACGLPVVDFDREGNAINYGGDGSIAVLMDPEPAVMARQLAAVIDETADLEHRSALGLAFVRSFPTEEEMGRKVEELIVARLAAGR